MLPWCTRVGVLHCLMMSIQANIILPYDQENSYSLEDEPSRCQVCQLSIRFANFLSGLSTFWWTSSAFVSWKKVYVGNVVYLAMKSLFFGLFPYENNTAEK